LDLILFIAPEFCRAGETFKIITEVIALQLKNANKDLDDNKIPPFPFVPSNHKATY
jgi:hypothetical protein